MYGSHRAMVTAPPNTRLTELLDQLRQEFDNQSRSTGEFEHQRMIPRPFLRCTIPSLTDICSDRPAPGDGDDPAKGLPVGAGSAQDETRVRPLFISTGTMLSLTCCTSYEAEIRTLRMELESRGIHVPPSHVGGPPPHGGPSQAPPPALGHGPSNLFGGIMANQGGGAPALAPPPPPQDQQQGAQHSLQNPPNAQGPPQPPQGAFGGYQQGSAVNGSGMSPEMPCRTQTYMYTVY